MVQGPLWSHILPVGILNLVIDLLSYRVESADKLIIREMISQEFMLPPLDPV